MHVSSFQFENLFVSKSPSGVPAAKQFLRDGYSRGVHQFGAKFSVYFSFSDWHNFGGSAGKELNNNNNNNLALAAAIALAAALDYSIVRSEI